MRPILTQSDVNYWVSWAFGSKNLQKGPTFIKKYVYNQICTENNLGTANDINLLKKRLLRKNIITEKSIELFNRKIDERLKGNVQTPLALNKEYEKTLYENFILKKDAKVISDYARDKQCAISIRKTGKASLDRLKQGAGTKPHSILDKSLKESTAKIIAGTRNIDPLNSQTTMLSLLNFLQLPAEMEGHVPHWINEKKDIDGFYLTEKGVNFCNSNNIKIKSDKNRNKYILISDCKYIIKKCTKKWHSFFITGDYDAHEIVKFRKFGRHGRKTSDGQYPRIPKATNIESISRGGDTGIMKDINDLLAKNYNYSESQRRLQHGAQVNYEKFAKANGEAIVPSLLHADFPVALCDRGTWMIIYNQKELKGWYNSVKIKYPWKE